VVKEDKVNLWHIIENQCKKSWDKRAIWSREGSCTFGELYEETVRIAQWMLDEGVRPGELVGMYLINSPHFVFVWFACLAIGCAPAFINYNLEGKALLHCLEVAETRLLVVDQDAGCQNRINASRGDLEARGMKIAVLDNDLKRSISSRPRPVLGDELRAGTKGEFPYCLIFTR
jgi:acyl-CoA synthetase (AMP-forming)/AMP-acid ligase II